MRARFGGMFNPLCKNTRTTGANDEAILNDKEQEHAAGFGLGLTIRRGQ